MYPRCFLRHRVLSGKPHHPACYGSMFGLFFPCRPPRELPSQHNTQRIPSAFYAVGFALRQSRPGRRPTHTEMDQLAQGGRQAAADLSERVSAAHLTKQHRDEVIPAAEPLGRSLSGVLWIARAKAAQSIRAKICAKQLATATMRHLRLMGGTAQTRRG